MKKSEGWGRASGVKTFADGIKTLLDLASNVAEHIKKVEEEGGDKNYTGQFETKSGLRGVYGFNVSIGTDNKPTISKFGNISHTERGPVIEEMTEPIVDIFDEEDEILLIVEIPGTDEDKIKIEIEGDILNLTAEGKDHKYAKEILLKSEVQTESMKQHFKNGILEVRLAKKK